jgi:hypothetical protein
MDTDLLLNELKLFGRYLDLLPQVTHFGADFNVIEMFMALSKESLYCSSQHQL